MHVEKGVKTPFKNIVQFYIWVRILCGSRTPHLHTGYDDMKSRNTRRNIAQPYLLELICGERPPDRPSRDKLSAE